MTEPVAADSKDTDFRIDRRSCFVCQRCSTRRYYGDIYLGLAILPVVQSYRFAEIRERFEKSIQSGDFIEVENKSPNRCVHYGEDDSVRTR